MSWPRAVTVDLDDTLFPQCAWLDGAWTAVAVAGGWHGLPVGRLRAALVEVAALGSDRGSIIDRAVEAVGGSSAVVPDLVDAFGRHSPSALPLFPGVAAALEALRASGRRVVVVTDGNPSIQAAKADALGLHDLVDAVVMTDALGGRAVRKPHPAGFRVALDILGVPAADAVHVGDRPAKDVVGAAGMGMRCVRVLTGEYAAAPEGEHLAWATVSDFPSAVGLLLDVAA
jgi:putative hydrolase of the HAD superfamily